MNAFRALLLASISFSAAAQTGHFDAIENALGLTTAQIDFLQQWTPPDPPIALLTGPTAPARRQFTRHEETTRADFILTDPQTAKLEILESEANRWRLAYLAISSGLMSETEWPWGIPIFAP